MNLTFDELSKAITHYQKLLEEGGDTGFEDELKSITKDVIKKGLGSFFGGNDAQVEGAFQAILDAAPVKETEGVSLTGLRTI
jgi:hypothetical protein